VLAAEEIGNGLAYVGIPGTGRVSVIQSVVVDQIPEHFFKFRRRGDAVCNEDQQCVVVTATERRSRRQNQDLAFEPFKELIDSLPKLKWINLTGEGSAFLNQDFMKYVKELAKPDDTVVVYCATGGRSAKAADDMVKAGYKDVINMLGGIEEKDGWKNSDLPLDYMMKVKDLDPKFVYPPDRP